jgi:hypothetical protein
MRKLTLFTAVGAVVLIGAAAAVRFVALPALYQLPADLDTTVQLSGTADLVDAAALQTGDLAKAMRPDTPVVVRERVRVSSTDGAVAVVLDETTMTGPNQTSLVASHRTWAVSRTTMEAAPAPAGATVQPHEGLVVGFPLSPQARDYTYWDTSTETAVPAKYLRAERKADRDTYVYQVQASGPLKDADTLAGLPSTLSKEAILGLAASLPPAQQQLLAPLAGLLPAQIPLTYTTTTDTTFWIDTLTGSPVDVHRKQVIAAGPPGGFAGIKLPTEFTVELAYTPDTVTASRDLSASAQQSLFLFGTVTPLGLVVLGLILALVAIVSFARRRRTAPPPAPAPAPDPAPVNEPV